MNPDTPPGYATASAQFGKIFGQTIRKLQLRKTQLPGGESTFDELLTPLQRWWDGLPAYLRSGGEVMSLSLRAVSFLCLRYYHLVILITRPYLLDSVMDPGSLDQDQIKCAEFCETANKESLLVIKKLARMNLICKWSYLDFQFALANGMILFLRCLKNPSRELAVEVNGLLSVAQEADHLHFARFGLRSMQILDEDLKQFRAEQW